MRYKLVIAEKPSVAQSLAAVIGATARKDGYLEGNDWRVSWCVGHLAGLADADSYDPKYAKWRYDDLPILPEHWQMVVGKDKKKQFDILKKLMNAPDVTEVVNACDAGREGELIFRSVYELAGCQKPMKRLWISSMEDSAIREGFANLRPGVDYDGLRDAALCTLAQHNGKWLVADGKAALRPIYDAENKKVTTESDAELTALLKPVHEATREFVAQPIGKATDNMYSYLALVQDDPTIQIVNQAQKAYVEKVAPSVAAMAGLPILSAGAPFKAGGRKNDPTGYTEVNKGELTFRNAADLYLYPNTLVVVKTTGEELKEWLECSAGMFKQIAPTSDKPQSLLDWEGFRTYNYDVIDGVNYEFDLTQPARYDGECKLINPNSHRVVNLTYQGKPVDPKAEFLIATNNYRAYGNKFPGTGDAHIVYASPDENRQILADYIKAESEKNGHVNPSADKNWRFAPIKGNDKLDVRFETSPSEQAAKFIQDNAQYPMKKVGTDEVGFAVYQIDLSK